MASTNDLIEMSPQESNVTDGDSDYEDLPSPDVEGDDTDELCHSDNLVPLSFTKVHDVPLAFKDPCVNMLIPGCPINVQIVDVERHPATHMLNPNLYILELQHGPYQWTIKRRYKHFQHLHQQLSLFRTGLSIPIPTKRHKARRKSCRKVERSRLPRFPKRPDALLTADKISQRSEQLEEYLKNILRIPLYRNHHETMDFLEICPLSFLNGLGKKRKGWRWLLIKDHFVAYVKPEDGRVRSVLLMDQGFRVECGFVNTGIHHGLQISNLSRHLLVRCWTRRKAREWSESLLEAAKTTARDFTQPNRFESFCPVRNNSECRWFIDGATYFEAVAEALEKAKEEIFIADWWLSPELYMKRPVIQGEIWRLDHILKRKAQQGVKVFVLLYKEVEFALGINSLYSKQQLVEMHPNIKVLRHPDHVTNGTLLWAHHEKLVCVDQTYAFIGGIDLCYGRWDDFQHRLTDLGGVGRKTSQVTLGGDANSLKATQSPQLRRSHSMSEIGNELNVIQQNEFAILSFPAYPYPAAEKSKTDSSENLESITINIEVATPTSSQIITPSSEEKKSPSSEELEYPSSHKKAVDNEECAKKRYMSRKLKAKRVMQAVVHLQGLKKQAHNKSLESITNFDSLDLPDSDVRRTNSEIAF
ncbi:phospholipase D1 [Caerostris extrusa]|uniref:phospholipase D n=1 Tax=Caerostris extrusa TaxID=172846 RepID=A0AAV4TMI5_CAEEX|nr:phospholipase D1 [Caerostris extrusa]